jgi:hypothetical protein
VRAAHSSLLWDNKPINIRKDFIESKEFKIRYENYYFNAEQMVIGVLIAVDIIKTPAIRNTSYIATGQDI